MKKAELVFIPSPGIGHLVSTIEIAKLLVERDDRLSITVLVIKLPNDSKTTAYTEAVVASSSITKRIKFINLPDVHNTVAEVSNIALFFHLVIEAQKQQVQEAVQKLILHNNSDPDSPRLAGFVIDMFCTTMIDIANEFDVPTYMFYTSSAGYLGMSFHLQTLYEEHNIDTTELNVPNTEFKLPYFVNPVPAKVLPSVILFDKEGATAVRNFTRRFKETKGIIVNTFTELESYAGHSFFDTNPTLYPVGPIMNLKGDTQVGSGGTQQRNDIIKWLDEQPLSSVVFLCFGSMGSFNEDQVKEIAYALEKSGVRFLWSLRQAPPKGKVAFPSDYSKPQEVLPDGFLERTAEIGKVIGWAPQVEILAHKATGGFVSHCGWNSTLESIYFGVPIATWPVYAEQQFNAFELVKELGLAVEIRMDYNRDFYSESEMFVNAEQIERGIRCVMEQDSDIRKRVKEMSEKSRKALMDGGSSYSFLDRLIDDIMNNMS
ncbi:Glycosyltransferase [Quillaja saponaria]|uniref:Glycosyltransferase n=1 Tax=Quillaja saponaria TaxID=32244 RepID=A0AAD7VCH8_QUISA|nr:Glycosyltransferase [Quillaja saponaria]